jgi:hypothetical protein
MDRLFVRIAWALDWAGVFSLTCATGSLILHYWFSEQLLSGILLLGVFRWLALASVCLVGARVVELLVYACTGHDHYAALDFHGSNLSGGQTVLNETPAPTTLRRAA